LVDRDFVFLAFLGLEAAARSMFGTLFCKSGGAERKSLFAMAAFSGATVSAASNSDALDAMMAAVTLGPSAADKRRKLWLACLFPFLEAWL
jgi:hypothetical protein